MSFNETKRQVQVELERIEEDVLNSGKAQYEASARWGRLHYWIGIPAVLIGASAGVSFFVDYPKIAGAMAVSAALLTALQTFLKPDERASEAKSAGDAYGALRSDARIFRQVKLPTATDPEAVTLLDELSARRAELNTSSPQPWKRDRRRALAGIKRGDNVYRVDNRL